MAICLEGYSSHCSFMERHKALVAACDILRSKMEVPVSAMKEERKRTVIADHGQTQLLP